MDLRDKYGPTALVTGASSGIGKSFAEELARAGLDLVITARRVERLEQLATRLRADYAVDVCVVEADLADPATPAAIHAACADKGIGLVVSNAGFSVRGFHETIGEQDMAEMLAVNCSAPLHLSRLFLPQLKARERAGFVMVSSIEALIGCPISAAYSAMKALVLRLGEGLYAEAIGTGVDMLTVCPGATDTEAGARAGIDMSTIPNVQDPDELATLALDALGKDVTCFPHPIYKAQFDQLLAMPRSDALMAMRQAMPG